MDEVKIRQALLARLTREKNKSIEGQAGYLTGYKAAVQDMLWDLLGEA